MATHEPIQRHLRSCSTCHRRKLKCDKQLPCSNCRKSLFDCDYPVSKRARKKSRIESSSALKTRLEKLESLVQGLHKDVSQRRSTRNDAPVSDNSVNAPTGVANHELGRLVYEDGENRYIENSFWVALSNEVSEIRNLIDDRSDNSEKSSPSHDTPAWLGEHIVLYNFNAPASDLTTFHPSSDEMMLLWGVFVDNVDPLIRVLHKPTVGQHIARTKDRISQISRSYEALLFAIYFASVTSLSEIECQTKFREEKEGLLRRYRFALQQALARAEFMSSHSLTSLQAIAIYLMCERHHDGSRFVWTLSATAIRIAQSLGLHHDGSALHLPIFETEMRRRIWWQIWTCDVRTAENHGFNQDMMAQHRFDTKLPMNIDDGDLLPDSQDPPTPKSAITEMSLSLMRYEITSVLAQLMSQIEPLTSYRLNQNSSFADDIDKVMNTCREKLEANYLKHCDRSVPSHWFMSTVARMMLAKMWINIHHRFKTERGSELTEQSKARIFELSMEIVESCLLLDQCESTAQWRWAFRNYIPWQALAFILFQICEQTQNNEKMDNAWDLVESAFKAWVYESKDRGRDSLWRRMGKLKYKAQRARARLAPELNMADHVDNIIFESLLSTEATEQTFVGEADITGQYDVRCPEQSVRQDEVGSVEGPTSDSQMVYPYGYGSTFEGEELSEYFEYDPFLNMDLNTGIMFPNEQNGQQTATSFEQLSNWW